ncbi:regulatory signaling modulator protein AmpE, partial [Salmonella enterica]|uniref:regulatory signaling modulator protein AmpE n=1 Tax=Salmonella enterica TaxID=28901 RepID=UPI00398C4016
MTLFTTLLVLIVVAMFKLGEHWQMSPRLDGLLRRIPHLSILCTGGMTLHA